MNNNVIALDLEGTLISNGVSQFPRPGLYAFLEFCRETFSRIVIYTAVPPDRVRGILSTLVHFDEEKPDAPPWFEHLEIVEWDRLEKDAKKDLRRIPGAEWGNCWIVDDQEGYIRTDQRSHWFSVSKFSSPDRFDDRDLVRLTSDMRKFFAGSDLSAFGGDEAGGNANVELPTSNSERRSGRN